VVLAGAVPAGIDCCSAQGHGALRAAGVIVFAGRVAAVEPDGLRHACDAKERHETVLGRCCIIVRRDRH